MFRRGDLIPFSNLVNKPKRPATIYREDRSISIPGINIGDYKFSVSSGDHDGWLLCDGRLLTGLDYYELFQKIGTAFGSGCHEGTFMLPNCKGRVPAATSCGHPIGETVGEETHTLTGDEMPSHQHDGTTASSGSHSHSAATAENGNHTHTINDPGHTHSQTTINDDFNNSGATPPGFSADSAGSRTWYNISTSTTGITINSAGAHTHSVTVDANGEHTHTFTTQATGGGAAHNNMQPTLFLGNLFIFSGIKPLESFPV